MRSLRVDLPLSGETAGGERHAMALYYYVFGDADSTKFVIGQRLSKRYNLKLFLAEDYCSIEQADRLVNGAELSLSDAYDWTRSMKKIMEAAGGGVLVLPMMDEARYLQLTANNPNCFIYATDGPQADQRPGSYCLNNVKTLNADIEAMEAAIDLAAKTAAKAAAEAAARDAAVIAAGGKTQAMLDEEARQEATRKHMDEMQKEMEEKYFRG